MRISRKRIGFSAKHAGQESTPVDEYCLDAGDQLKITAWTLGASLIEVWIPDRAGTMQNVVVRMPDIAAYEHPGNRFLGATLGRYARCISNARVQIDGVEYELDRNAGRHHVHGGSIGFDRFVWRSDADRVGDSLVLKMWLERPDGDQGYPGELLAEVTFAVELDRLTFNYRATTSRPTVVAMTNHSSWNLAGRGSIDGHRLRVNADRVLLVDQELMPVGIPVPVANTDLDYRASRTIAQMQLDNTFALDDPAWAAELEDPESGRTMLVFTDQPGLQVYSGDVLASSRSGICLQTGAWPDSPNRPDYPSSDLLPGETYSHFAQHQFSVR